MEGSSGENDNFSGASPVHEHDLPDSDTDATEDLPDSDSDDAGDSEAPGRLPWTKIWRSTDPDAFPTFRASLPAHSIGKSDRVNCTIDHAFDKDYDLACVKHEMRSRRTKCKSKRCHTQPDDDGYCEGDDDAAEKCPARYRFKMCLKSGTIEVFAHGDHLMDNDGPSSPIEKKLTPAMKAFISEKLDSGAKTTAAKLFVTISAMVEASDMAGPVPERQQVVDFVKNWRRSNPKNSMAPMIEICDGHLYDQQDVTSLSGRAMIILCDTQPDAESNTNLVSHLGDGSEAFPFRVGITCLQLIRGYVSVQNREECTTLLHVDSTHSMVINGNSVFAFGYSDQSCHFMPLAYFCTSQKRKIDIGWCIRWIKRLCAEACGAVFAPRFVMTDADKAQFNACVTELPTCTVLMCWFHVTQNVWKYVRQFHVSKEETRESFEELYDLHYAPETEFESVKQRVLSKWEAIPAGSAARKLTQHIIRQWLNTHRFGRW
ncbi:hypothetical protein PF004_g29683 [Phytophthora fragariae]|uniref:MULE transposase domain-containing protein n=1 Tax=Phytophthora fragariae TaxID=53985 RepID=A0A6G0MEE2_9STRA|nr:hypothetical protein PF004_g29683 [Phytophthora fragariae]